MRATAFWPTGLILAASVSAQQPPKPQFEVASIRQRAFSPGVMGVEYRAGGRVVATMASLDLLITSAYGIQPAQLQFGPNLPDAVVKSFYDIEAKAEPDALPAGELSRENGHKVDLMLQALLEDRFKLRIHTEKKELPVYVLLADKNGVKLQKAPIRDCSKTPSPCLWIRVGPASGAVGQSVTIQSLADRLTMFEGRTILNQTGIEDKFDIQLPPFSRGADLAGAVTDGAPVDVNAPSIVSVLRDVGLRLESKKQLLDVYIVDHIEKPSAN